MDRRNTLKTILLGTVAGGAMLTGTSCDPIGKSQEKTATASPLEEYGRTPAEKERDAELMSETFFTPEEMATITILCDIILPKDDISGAASEAGVPDFIEFIVKDIPDHQLPLRGGLMWLDLESKQRFGTAFRNATAQQRLEIVEDIAYIDIENDNPLFSQGIKFFDLMRDLTVTGFYTSEMGIKTLGYQGNIPNLWDGVPEDVLQKHGLAYEENMLAKYIDHNKREEIAVWDDAGNLVS